MKILVLGAGATGGYFGGRLAQAATAGKTDVEVTFLVRPARAEALRAKGLQVQSPHGDFSLPVRTVLHTELKPEYDLVLLSCKAYDLESSILAIYPAVGPETLILPVLNGLAHYERLDAEFGVGRVLGGCCHMAGNLTPEGVVRQMTELHRITFGLREGNAPHARRVLTQLEAAYKQTPVEPRFPEKVLQDIWEKYVMLTALASTNCLMRATVGDLQAADEGQAIALRALAECEAAATHAGYPSRPKAAETTAKMLTTKGSTFHASMLRDLESGARTEGQHIVADMLKRSRAAGTEATVLSLAWAHLQARDARLARETKA
ncbi:MAG: Ketopantoate reductase [Betaproteobacteria bacterium]|nr:Ketopantoate reductase [Betaproteobacteria bacterium]